MKLEELNKLSQEEKEKMLKDLIKNDVTYWQKLLLILSIEDDKYEKLLDTIIENKIKEISLADPKAKYGLAFRQVNEILKYIPKKYYDKISPNFLAAIQKNADMKYDIKIQPGIDFSEIVLLEESKIIFSMISKKFWKEDDKYIEISDIFNKN